MILEGVGVTSEPSKPNYHPLTKRLTTPVSHTQQQLYNTTYKQLSPNGEISGKIEYIA